MTVSNAPFQVMVHDLNNTNTVLVVDDDERVCQSFKAGLAAAGFNVLTASEGGEAIKLLASDATVDLLLSDVMMAGVSGVDLARASRRLRPQLPVLLITGYAFELMAQLGARQNEFEVIQKPCRIDRLTERIRQLIAAGVE